MYVFEPHPRASVAVAGSTARFPVRRLFCVGRNYAAHAREMGADPDREPPFFFAKPADAVVDAHPSDHARVAYPPRTADLHHEVELAVAVGPDGIYGMAVALDLTRRDLQRDAKSGRRPWFEAKAFDASAPIGRIVPGSPPATGRIWCAVDGEVRQDADLAELIWPVADVLRFLGETVALQPGDLVLTGTPAGVGPVGRGQTVTAGIDGVGELAIEVV